MVLKIAGKVLFARYASEINAHFGKLQFGCLHKKGVERVVHNVRADIAQGRHILAVDQANAFNTPHRFRIAMALYAVPVFRYFWRIFFLEYGTVSDLLFFDEDKLFERIPSQHRTRARRRPCAMSARTLWTTRSTPFLCRHPNWSLPKCALISEA